MTSLLKFSAIAASRGEGLHPKLRDLFERVAAFPNSEVMHHDGMLQAGSPPASKNSEPLGDVISLLRHYRRVARRMGRTSPSLGALGAVVADRLELFRDCDCRRLRRHARRRVLAGDIEGPLARVRICAVLHSGACLAL